MGPVLYYWPSCIIVWVYISYGPVLYYWPSCIIVWVDISYGSSPVLLTFLYYCLSGYLIWASPVLLTFLYYCMSGYFIRVQSCITDLLVLLYECIFHMGQSCITDLLVLLYECIFHMDPVLYYWLSCRVCTCTCNDTPSGAPLGSTDHWSQPAGHGVICVVSTPHPLPHLILNLTTICSIIYLFNSPNSKNKKRDDLSSASKQMVGHLTKQIYMYIVN